ncbi:hypothetical protein MMC18_003104 [Xylographa bjoerkii]|nr:hypothetical protein [Xylographa bjoerkii]
MSDRRQEPLGLSVPSIALEKRDLKRRNIPRVGRACDRCRLKKCKCDGQQPCQRCNSDNAICNSTRRIQPPDRAFSKEDVKVLSIEHKQLSQGLQHLYQHVIQNKPWEGLHVQLDRNGQPLVHEILERIGIVGGNVDFDFAHTGEEEQAEEEEEQEEETDAPPQTPSLSSCKSAVSPVCYDFSEAWIPQPSNIEPKPKFWVPVMVEDPVHGRYLPNNVFFTEPMEKEEFFYY